MAYMRGNYYLWSDGDNLHIWVADGYDGWDKAIWPLMMMAREARIV